MKKVILILLVLFEISSASGQKKWQKAGLKIDPPVCYASGKVEKSYIPPAPEVLQRLKSSETKADIHVTYSLFPNDAKKAFEFAVNVWEQIIDSPIKIYIQANWRPKDMNVLGSCGPSDYLTNFKGIPHKNRYYPIAIAEKITRKEITGISNPDLIGEFNNKINWYFGTDGNTPDSLYDFVTVAMHEIGHGLGFTGFFYVNQLLGSYAYTDVGDASAFDLLVVRNTGAQLVDTSIYKNPSEELRKALESGQLYANTPVGILNNDNQVPRLYSPSQWDDGSSVYHLNDATYPFSNPNSLMTHAIGKGEAIHDPGPITRGIMADIGWENMFIDFEPLKDKEQVSPLSFNVKITSDYALDESSLYVVYSADSFQTQIDTIHLLPTEVADLYTAELIPDDTVKTVKYYISATDVKTRVFRAPAEAPKEVYTVKFGPDTEKPQIVHQPIDYYFMVDDNLHISAKVTDNLGVDTVYVEYAINGVPQKPFGLKNDSASIYVGIFNFNKSMLNDGDVITYVIMANDASSANNSARLPQTGNFSFKIEQKLEAVGGYMNNFNDSTSDFILSDFSIYTPTGFDNGALQSPHPYPSPEIDDSVFNFTTILKHPIILYDGAIMSFDEVVLVEPGSTGTQFGDENFWDYVVVEGSTDNGDSWQPLADGYDSRANSNWEEIYNQNIVDQVSSAVGRKQMYVNREIDMLQNENFSVGDTILIRFRLFSDPYAHGWGWAIDNLRIQFPVAVRQPVLSPGNIAVYPNPFENSFKVKIDFDTEMKNVQLVVLDMYGRKIKTLQYDNRWGSFTDNVTLPGVQSGMYLINVSENGLPIFSQKLIKK